MPGNLVLQRSVGEEIVILCPDGAEIPIKYVSARPSGKIRLSINAPPAYRVHRREISDRIKRELDAQFTVPTTAETLAATQAAVKREAV